MHDEDWLEGGWWVCRFCRREHDGDLCPKAQGAAARAEPWAVHVPEWIGGPYEGPDVIDADVERAYDPIMERLPTAEELRDQLLTEIRRKEDLAAAIQWKPGETGRVEPDGGGEWTNALLNIVLDEGRRRKYLVYPAGCYFYVRNDRGGNAKYGGREDDDGEWMVDACWTTYPPGPYRNWIEGLRENRVGRCGMVLACESEWAIGQHGSLPADHHVNAVMEDFAKLTELRAPLKLMIFAFQVKREPTFETFVELFTKATAPVADGEAYLYMGWPSDATWPQRMDTVRTGIIRAVHAAHATG